MEDKEVHGDHVEIIIFKGSVGLDFVSEDHITQPLIITAGYVVTERNGSLSVDQCLVANMVLCYKSNTKSLGILAEVCSHKQALPKIFHPDGSGIFLILSGYNLRINFV